MNKTTEMPSLPDHLVGTRQGLFFLLQAGDPQLADEPVIPPTAPSQHHAIDYRPRTTIVAPKAKYAEVLASDDFHFNL